MTLRFDILILRRLPPRPGTPSVESGVSFVIESIPTVALGTTFGVVPRLWTAPNSEADTPAGDEFLTSVRPSPETTA